MEMKMEGMIPLHEFCSQDESYDIVLLTNRNFPEITGSQLKILDKNARIRISGPCVSARVQNLDWVSEIRLYEELLFVIEGMNNCQADPELAATRIINSDLLPFLTRNHKGALPYFFDLSYDGRREGEEKEAFLNSLSGMLESLSDELLVEAADHSDFELRIQENMGGNCSLFIKLHTMKDERFLYRVDPDEEGISPDKAALVAELAKEFLREEAEVLDPYCGDGTFLIERVKAVKTAASYGMDNREELVIKAKRNGEAAALPIDFFKEDFLNYKAERQYDEIFTYPPSYGEETEETQALDFYSGFLASVYSCLKKNGILVLTTRDKRFINETAGKTGLLVKQAYKISKSQGTWVMILYKK